MAMNSDFDREVTFQITEPIGTITTYDTGWSKELNLVSWNGGTPKYDIRDWDPDHEHMSRGVTLHEKEMRQVLDLLRKRRQGRGRPGSVGTTSNGSSEAAPTNPTEKTEEMDVMTAIAEEAEA